MTSGIPCRAMPRHRRSLRRIVIVVAFGLVATCCVAEASPSAPPSPAPSPSAASTASIDPGSSPSPVASRPPSSPTAPTSPGPSGPAAWSRLDAGGDTPPAREDHTWTVDPATGIAYLFGGRDGADIRGDLFEFDPANARWRRLEPAGPRPEARFGHEAVWVDGRGLVIFAGQAGPTAFFDDLWAYEPGSGRWTRLAAGGDRPVARYGSCAAIGRDGRLWISHGFTSEGSRFFDTKAYDFGSGRWTDETPAGQVPVARCLHGCFVAEDGRFVLYAGQTTGVEALGDLWALRRPGRATAGWTRVDGRLPAERRLYAYARVEGAWVVIGGQGLGGRYLADAHVVDAETLRVAPLRTSGDRPSGRSGATLIADGSRLFLFGGMDRSGARADLWQLDLAGSLD